MGIHSEPYRPTHIFSQLLPLQSTQEMLTEYDGRKLINFSCIGYESLVQYCKMFKLHDFEYNYHYDLVQNEQVKDAQTLSARMEKREMSENEDDEKRQSIIVKKRKKNQKRVKFVSIIIWIRMLWMRTMKRSKEKKFRNHLLHPID